MALLKFFAYFTLVSDVTKIQRACLMRLLKFIRGNLIEYQKKVLKI